MNRLKSKCFELENDLVYVIDGCFSDREISAIQKQISTLPAERVVNDSPKTKHAVHYGFELDPKSPAINRQFRKLFTQLGKTYPDEHISLYHVVCNNIVYGDLTYAHRDCDKREDDISALYFANSTWENEWGGEFIFFDSSGDSRYAIMPRPGRMVFFRGRHLHRAGIPLRSCFSARHTVSFRFRCKS